MDGPTFSVTVVHAPHPWYKVWMDAESTTGAMSTLGQVEDAIYRVCLQHGPMTAEELHRHLTGEELDSSSDLDSRLDALAALGLLQTIDGMVDALPPRATLHDHADQMESAAEHIRRRANGWGELWQQYRTRPSYIEVLDDDRVAATFQEHVLNRTRHELAGLQVRPAGTPGTRPKIVPGFFEAAERGVQFKVVYGVSVLRDPLGLSSVQQCITHGEDARVFPDIPLNLRISDGRVAIVTAPDDSVGGRRSTVVVHPSGLLTSLIRLFDSYWRMSVPISVDAEPVQGTEPPSEESRQMLAYLSAGLTDESIAREIGVSERTVGRRVARLQELLGAHSRFQLGSQAVRRGWI